MFASLVLVAGAACAQIPPGPASYWSPPPGPGFSFQRGPDSLDIRCAEGEPLQACADAASGMLDRFRAMPSGSGRPPPFTAPARAAQPLPTAAQPDVAPTIWTRPSPRIDPTRLPLGNGRMVTDAP